jgi:hypothetical protein
VVHKFEQVCNLTNLVSNYKANNDHYVLLLLHLITKICVMCCLITSFQSLNSFFFDFDNALYPYALLIYTDDYRVQTVIPTILMTAMWISSYPSDVPREK